MDKRKRRFVICCAVFVLALLMSGGYYLHKQRDTLALAGQQKQLERIRDEHTEKSEAQTEEETESTSVPTMLPEYAALYEENEDIIGWLTIEGTQIDYPVMQTPEDEDYYLTYDFYKQENSNGCLIMDTDSNVGIGEAKDAYAGGSAPSTNLIIHGHTMRSGAMFGTLSLYEEESYGKDHSLICFDSLYEKRDYELIAAFYSQVYYQSEDVFKYYKFFEADTQEEFDNWYDNIKEMSLYDTGVTAELGDEFLTLSCCSYQVENGRFVVVGKRIK